MSEFKWTDELVAEYGQFYHRAFDDHSNLGKCMMQKFIESKQPKKEWNILVTCKNEDANATDRILSVRRLSDGEVFSVGDDAVWEELPAKITKFKISDDDVIVYANYGIALWCANLKWISKHKQPLFTTEDGKPVYEGDKYWYVDTEDNEFEIGNSKAEKYNSGNCSLNKYFSTKDAAEEYVLMNKPCLSVKDVVEKFYVWDKTRDAIKELAKSKL